MKSPDGSICLEFSLSDKGQPEYVVFACGETFIGKSVLGMEISTPANLKSGFSLKSSRVKRHSERWTQPWGENKEMLDEHRELEVILANDDCCLTLRFRAFDDGVGFRYEYDIPGDSPVVITDELTQFNIAQDGDSWSIPAHFDSYEQEYRKMRLSELEDANTPMTF